MIELSALANVVQPSATLAAGALAKQLRSEGVTVYDFSLGEPDFTTPEHILTAAFEAMKAGDTHYTPANGTAELRQAVSRYYKRLHQFDCSPDEVIISNGAKHSIHTTLEATVGPGDEVIIPTPYWVSYSDLVAMTGAKPVLVATTPESGFKMSPEQFRAALSDRSKLIMLNSPSNPTGCVYRRDELAALADIALTHPKIGILSDEIYEQLIFGDAEPTCLVTLRPELRERVITISGVSKTYAMTGWRIGWTVAPGPVVKAMSRIQGQQSGCPSSVSQAAAVAALDGPQDCVQEMRTHFARRRKLVCSHLSQVPGVTMPTPDGAFYAFFDVSSHFGRELGGITVSDSVTFCQALLKAEHVNLVPGAAFGAEGYVRMSYAAADDQLEEGLRRLKSFLE